MNQFATLCLVLGLFVLPGCASSPEGQMIQMKGYVKIAAQAALEEGDLSKEDLEKLAKALEAVAGDASKAGEVSVGSVSEVVLKALDWKGYKGAIVEGLLVQVDVLVAENRVGLSVGQYSEWLLAVAEALRKAAV